VSASKKRAMARLLDRATAARLLKRIPGGCSFRALLKFRRVEFSAVLVTTNSRDMH
jgi:hypothetical protein